MNHGLIGTLLDYIKKINLIHSQKDFLPTLFLSNNYGVHDTTLASIVNYDYFPVGEKDYLDKLFAKNQAQYLDSINQFFFPLSDCQKIDVNLCLLKSINAITTYGKKRNPQPSNPNDWGMYDAEQKERLSVYYEQKAYDPLTLPYNVFLYIGFAVDKQISKFFPYGPRYHDDLREFNESVLCRYGVISSPGRRAIMELAFKPDGTGNIFALYEYADMLYYGDNVSQTSDYAEAIKVYEIAAGIRKMKGMETACHPLALFSLSYIFFNYHRGGTLKNIPNIEYLENFSDSQRIELAIKYSKKSVILLESGATYNNLGVISNYLSDSMRIKYQLKNARYYYEKAADLGYVYAYNNLAVMESELIDSDSQNTDEHLNNYLYFLSKSADMYEPWGANWLGNFYLKGVVNGSQSIFENRINKELAQTFFIKATQYHMDRNSAWAVANLIVYYPEFYVDHSDLLHSHIDILLSKGDDDILSFIAKICGVDFSDFLHQQNTQRNAFCDEFRDTIITYMDTVQRKM